MHEFRLKNGPGFFAMVNQVIDRCYQCAMQNVGVKVVWESRNNYGNGLINVWTEFFEQPFKQNIDFSKLPRMSGSMDRRKVIKPGKPPAEQILLPLKQPFGKIGAKKFIKIKPNVKDLIQKTQNRLPNETFIGVHCRGPLRLHGGTAWMRNHYELQNNLPFKAFCEYIDKFPKTRPIFLATDAKLVIDMFTKKYGIDRVYYLECIRPKNGEPHRQKEENKKGVKLQLAYEVLLDTFVLGRVSDVIVHGNSNVTNFLRCRFPEKTMLDIYQTFYD